MAGNALDDICGPFRDDENIVRYLGVTKAEVDALVAQGVLLRVRSSDGFAMYPDFKFDEDRHLLPRLVEVLDALDGDRDNAWGAACGSRRHPATSTAEPPPRRYETETNSS